MAVPSVVVYRYYPNTVAQPINFVPGLWGGWGTAFETRMRNNFRHLKGFTLVELLVVIAIIAAFFQRCRGF
jgi:prepilin-type N-terminal cleavage/methylation domain-containing protein